MKKISEFLKKYHLIPYMIIIALIVVFGYGVKWYNYDGVGAILGQDTVAFYRYFNVIFVLILIAVTVVYYLAVIKKAAIEKLYVVCAAFIGVIFMLVVPPYASADEDRHILECQDFASAIFGYEMQGDKEHWLRECDDNTELSRDLTVKNYQYVAENFFAGCDSKKMELKYIDDITYDGDNVIYYYPGIVGITIGRLLNLGTILTYMLGRMFMLAAYIAITYFAIKKIPVFKAGYAIIMLMPSTMQRAATISYDGLLLAYIFIFVAYVFYYIYNVKTIKIVDAVVMAISGVLLTVGKGGAYIPFLLMLFMIPKENFGKKIKYGFIVSGAILLCLVAFVGFNYELFADIAGSTGGETNELLWTEEEGYTLKDIITAPKRSLKVFINTFIMLGGAKYSELIGNGFGWLQVYISDVWVVAFSLLMVLSLFNESEESFTFNKKQKLMLGVIGVASFGLVVLSMWLFWTPLNSKYIEGLQGRYFIPMLIPILFIFKNKLFMVQKRISSYLLCSAVVMYAGVFLEIWCGMRL